MTKNVKKNPLGTAGGVLGIVDVSLSFIFSWFLAPLFIVISIVAIALSGVGLRNAIRDGGSKGLSITGLATAIPTLAWNLLWTFALVGAVVSS